LNRKKGVWREKENESQKKQQLPFAPLASKRQLLPFYREVYLCSKEGEERSPHFHGIEEGFAGRKPLPKSLGHH